MGNFSDLLLVRSANSGNRIGASISVTTYKCYPLKVPILARFIDGLVGLAVAVVSFAREGTA